MLKKLSIFGSLAALFFTVSIGRTQAIPTATRQASAQLGFGYSFAQPDYGQRRIQGVTGFGDLDFGMHLGVEGDIHYIALVTPTDLAENTFLIGPRYNFRRKNFDLYAKVLFGVGNLVIQEQQDNVGHSPGHDFAVAFGGGLDIPVTRHIVVRAIDFEYQHWNYLTGLTPTVFTFGAAYKFR